MPEYVAELCRMQGGELIPFETMEFSADNHDEAVKHAVEWLPSANTPRQRLPRRNHVCPIRAWNDQSFRTLATISSATFGAISMGSTADKASGLANEAGASA